MEHMLLKIARQLDSLDESSLLGLWEKYAAIVSRFEPTRRWEEAALVFSLIQAKHWKNQLFNHSWAAQVRPDEEQHAPDPAFQFSFDRPAENDEPPAAPTRAKVIPFRPKEEMTEKNEDPS